MHDLKPITFHEWSLAPACSRHDLAIELHGDAIAFHLQLLDQLRQRQGIGKRALFTVNQQVHDNTVIESRNGCAAGSKTV